MAGSKVYISSTASVVAVNGQGVAIPLGLVTNLRVEKRWIVEPIIEWGSYFPVDIVPHGVSASFSWSNSYGPGVDLVAAGLIPDDVRLPQFLPFLLRIVDQLRQRNVVTLIKAIAETISVGAAGRATLAQDVAGQAISVLFESEVN